ncbi:MAG: tRNA (N(6)-L-threonylcarbamoyladenosine(37)-C(2))-methylthiotransferase MtaB [Oscillospiraceae bacterium]|nr:tRNA (N(6)-L-threonylcarbamoyladenosine(37)-C(2))-methylthiotransferase MtaB [Oscillospiraceae bacterium]
MKVAFYTIGCKVNQADSQAIRQKLLAAGYTPAEPEENPDVLVLNSCAVTAESERKTRQKLRHFRAINRDCILVLTGCSAQANPNAAEDYAEADLILGHRDAKNLPALLDAYLRCGERTVMISSHQRGEVFEDSAIECFPGRTRANVKIEDGCDRFCAYCIIPYARGRVRSKPLPALRTELETLASAGFAEIVLVGINLSAYGSDLGCTLCEAVELAGSISGIKRVRLGSLEPDLLNAEILQILSHCESLCPHFHISLQSGCDNTLRAMRRRYTAAEYRTLACEIFARFPDAALTTDVIVGFPGESDEDFAASLAFVEEIAFAKVHVFPFSPRKGTPAAEMAHQLPKAIKQERAHRMLALAERLRVQFLAAQVGKTAQLLLEQPHPLGGMQGCTANYTPVRLPEATPEMQNTLQPIKITALDACGGLVGCAATAGQLM